MQHILIVEDDLDIQDLLRNFLQEVGYEITIASDGMEAIALFSSAHFDLILLDIMLPKIDGFGMTYDTEKDRFFYNGQVVRYFKDQINSNETNGFSYDDGVIDVEPIRDEDGTLTGLKQSSDADFNARTKEQEALKAELEKAGITAGSGSFEQGDPNYRDDSLDAYTEFGVSYDKSSDHWMYGEKPIYILYDKEHYTFCDKGVSDGVSLNVVRDKAGNIEKLVSVDKGELEQFVK